MSVAASAPRPATAQTLSDLLRAQAARIPTRRAYGFVPDGETSETWIDFGTLDRRAHAVARTLALCGARTGECAILIYPPGLDFIVGFLGCVSAGLVAVPAYPPDPTRLDRQLPRLQRIAADAGGTIVLTTRAGLGLREPVSSGAPALAGLPWLATDDVPASRADAFESPEIGAEAIAMLQYTSGSTGEPRGVELTHHNLLFHCGLLYGKFSMHDDSRIVSWLPPYHDMGLIGTILTPLFGGLTATLLSPMDFLARPARWLEVVSRVDCAISGGPNFAYELCTRRVSDEEHDRLDLSGWEVAFCGSEPIRTETIRRFVSRFADRGLDPGAMYPCYGLAEATLLVTGARKGGGATTLQVDAAALERGEARPAGDGDPRARRLVGSGSPCEEQSLEVVDPPTLRALPPGRVGEIWVAGPSVAHGYWRRAAETEATFGARIANGDGTTYLRTGDLGFLHEGELYVTSRIKDLLIYRGRNLAPHDLEACAERSHPTLRPGCSACFAMDLRGEDQPVLVLEVRDSALADPDRVIEAVVEAVASELEVRLGGVVLVRGRSIPKTTSGKVRRRACRDLLLGGALDPVAQWLVEDAYSEATRGPAEDAAHLDELEDDGEGTVRDPAGTPGALRREVLGLPPGRERSRRLQARLRELAAGVLRRPPAEIDVRWPLADQGLESKLAVELTARLERALDTPLSAALLITRPTLEALAPAVARRASIALDAPAAPPAGARDEAPVGFGDLEAVIEDLQEARGPWDPSTSG